MKSFIRKFLICTSSCGIILVSGSFAFYQWGLPAIIKNKNIINYVQKKASETLNADIYIDNLDLKTGKTIGFKIDSFEIKKNNKLLLSLRKIDTLFDLNELLMHKRIIVKKITANEIYADADDLLNLLPQKEKKENQQLPVTLDFYNALLGIEKCHFVYNSADFNVDFKAKHIVFDRTKAKKFLHFDFDFILSKDDHRINISADDMNRFYMENGKAYIVNFPIEIDNSKIVINAYVDRKKNFELNIGSKNYSAKNIANIVDSNIFISNGHQMLEPIKDITGNVDFNLTLTKNKTQGKIDIKDVNFKVIPLCDLPVKITKGLVNIGNKDIDFKDFEGFYNNNKENKFKLKGITKDYQKTCQTKIESDIFITNDFFKNYLSKMLNMPIELVGDAGSRLIITSKNQSLDVLWFFLLRENEGFKFGEQSMVLKDYKTAFKADLSVVKNILKINTINYYITNELKRGIKPLITIDGNIDMADNMRLKDINLQITRPLPSEFLNFLACQKIFKKGYVSGSMKIDNSNKIPTMSGEFVLDKVLIPAQRLFINSGKLIAKGDKIEVKMDGRFRKANYIFDGDIVNEIKLPIIVKDVNLTVDNIDVERILKTSTTNEKTQNSIDISNDENDESDDAPIFTKDLIIIEKSRFNLKNGVYKEIKFGNLIADMTLNKDGIIELQSNRFDIADGISTLKVKADLINENYYLRLGIKDVDSNIMATSILGLPRQISGKAKGLVELNTDKSLKLNGNIKFRINNGTIEQIGYVEYILKVASLFRNPLAMFSPSTVFDLVNIPDGKFDDIYGELTLKNDVAQRIHIKSSAENLATYIAGRYDLKTNDASLRIYTKFSDKDKGFASALRKISLNSLASRLSISARNDTNYYAAELKEIPELKNGEKNSQIFLTKVDGDFINFNFLSSLKKIK